MILYYSAARANERGYASSSLGGFISSTRVYGSKEQSIFPNLFATGKIRRTRALVLKNTTSQPVEHPLIFIQDFARKEEIKYTLGLSIYDIDCGFERIVNEQDLPQSVEFFDVTSQFLVEQYIISSSFLNDLWIEIDSERLNIPYVDNIEQAVDYIVSAWRQHPSYRFQKIGTDSFSIENRNIENIVAPAVSSNLQIVKQRIVAPLDMSIKIKESLAVNEMVGIWISQIVDIKSLNCDELYQQFLDPSLQDSLQRDFKLIVQF